MAKEIPEETTDDTDDEAPATRPRGDAKRAKILEILAAGPTTSTKLAEVLGGDVSGVRRLLSTTPGVKSKGKGKNTRWYLTDKPAPRPRAKKAAPVEAPAPAEEAPADDTFSAEEMAVVLRLAAPGLRALLEKIERYT